MKRDFHPERTRGVSDVGRRRRRLMTDDVRDDLYVTG
jgi:hypothetical protein